VMFNLRRLAGLAEGLTVSAGSLARHGPAIRDAVAAAVLAAPDIDVELHPETGNIVARATPSE
jgi:hypothetical protein